MAQDYKAIDENEDMCDAPAQMKKNDEAIISNFAGADEPTTKMQGQFYFDTSTNTLKFYNGSNFVANVPCNITGTAARAKADESGRIIADTYLGKNERAKTSKALQTLERNTAYAVGDIAYCEQLPAGYYLECVTAGTTGNAEPTFNVGGVKVLDGSVEWNVALVASSAAVERINSELNNKLDSLAIATGIIHFDCVPHGSGAEQKIYLSETWSTPDTAIVATINSWANYWAGLSIAIIDKINNEFTVVLWNNDTINDVNDIWVVWQAINDGRN